MRILRRLGCALALVSIVMAAPAQTQVPPAAPPGMLPYIAVDAPQFVKADEAAFVSDDDPVIGIEADGMAKAYLAADLMQHGTVNDTMPDGPVAVTWCGSCMTAAVYRSELDGRTLHFAFDSLRGANDVNKDRETGSLWQQTTGEAIDGPLSGQSLQLYPFVRTSWSEWRRRFPETLVMEPQPGYADHIARWSERIRLVTASPQGDAPRSALRVDARLPSKEMVAGLRIGTGLKAYPFSALRTERVVNDVVNGTPVVIVHLPGSDTTTAFEARLGDRVLDFEPVGQGTGAMRDLQTGSRWDSWGTCLSGSLAGSRLTPLILRPGYWFAWSQFYPDTDVFLPET